MKSYPTVNWWKGNLRRYESVTSFVSRFAHMNGITIPQCELYFREELWSGENIGLDELERLAELLDEDADTLQETFIHNIRLPHTVGIDVPANRGAKYIRYCVDCAGLGYHSYLHEQTWLARCPFHAKPLSIAHYQLSYGTNRVRGCHALSQVMRAACECWPNAQRDAFDPESFEKFVSLRIWISRLLNTPEIIRKPRIWNSVQQPFPESKEDTHVIARLHALAPMPDDLKILFHYVEEGWGASIRRFPIDAKQAIEKVSDMGIPWLLSMYKAIAVYSAVEPEFVQTLKGFTHELQEHQSKCRCEWGRERGGYEYHWVFVDPENWPHWHLKCPFAVAHEALELATHQRLEPTLSQRRIRDDAKFTADFQILLERGLVGLAPNAKASTYGTLDGVQEAWPPVAWIGTPWLNAVLDAAAHYEMLSLYNSLRDWLRDIAEGRPPNDRRELRPPIWLCESEEGLVLIYWHRQESAQPQRL